MSTKAKTAKAKSAKAKKPRTLAEMHELIDLPQIHDALNRLSVRNAAKDSELESRINALWDAVRSGAIVDKKTDDEIQDLDRKVVTNRVVLDNRLDGFLGMLQALGKRVEGIEMQPSALANLEARMAATLAVLQGDVTYFRERLDAIESRIAQVNSDTANWLASIEHRVYDLERPGLLRRLWRHVVNLVNFTPERPA